VKVGGTVLGIGFPCPGIANRYQQMSHTNLDDESWLTVFGIDGDLSADRISRRSYRYRHVAEGAKYPAVRLSASYLMRPHLCVAYQLDLQHLQVYILRALADILQQESQWYILVASEDRWVR
jgi:hypothetical protein